MQRIFQVELKNRIWARPIFYLQFTFLIQFTFISTIHLHIYRPILFHISFFFGKVNPLNNSIYRTLVESTSSKKPDFISQRTVSILKFHFHKSIISSRNGYPKTYIIYYLGIFSKIRFEAKGKFKKKKTRILFIFHPISLFYNIPKHFQFSSPADL